LLAFRIIQGIGAAAMTLAIVIARDSFDESIVRQKLSYIIIAIYVSPIAAPSAGAALLNLGSWRLIYAVLAALGILLLIGTWTGLENRPRSKSTERLSLSAIFKAYRCVLSHPVARAYLFASAASFGVFAAYATGSSLFFTQIVGMSPNRYGTIFGLTALASVAGAFVDSRLSARGVSSLYVVPIGLAAVISVSLTLLAMTLTGWVPVPLTIALFAIATFSGGLTAPGLAQGAMQQLPQMSGTVSATSNCLVMMSGSVSGGLATVLFDGHTTLSMSEVMAFCSAVAGISFWMAIRHTRHRAIMQS
jgi:DHA1 family bicyclomycin/chloramphenicol resistance-like MFS transporter